MNDEDIDRIYGIQRITPGAAIWLAVSLSVAMWAMVWAII
jgi:hypothetical protein